MQGDAGIIQALQTVWRTNCAMAVVRDRCAGWREEVEKGEGDGRCSRTWTVSSTTVIV